MKSAVVAVLLSVILVSGCNGSDDKAAPSATSTKTGPTVASGETPTPSPTPTATRKPVAKPVAKPAAKPNTLSTAGRKCTVLEESLRLFPGHNLSMANRGSYLSEVRELQSMVNGAGDGSKCIPEDGDFGPVTKQAVVAYQTKNGLVVDGLVGEETWNHLNLVLSH